MPPLLERPIRRLWSGEAGATGPLLSAALLPLELAYAAGVALRNHAYDLGIARVDRADVPVVSVGNVLVGGTGKTPVTAWLARMLEDHGRTPAIVMRGYGGDEISLHRAWNPEIPVYVDADRRHGASRAAREGRRCVILDDGFQHRRLARDLDLVLHPAEDVSKHLLPRGPYREPFAAMRRADHVIVTRRTASSEEASRVRRRLRDTFPGTPVAVARAEPAGWSDLEGNDVEAPGGPLLAVTGIARPRSFATLAERTTGSPVELLAYPDHHPFSSRDLEEVRKRSRGRTVVITEKDAARVKGRPHPFGPSTRVLRLRVVCEVGREQLERVVLDAVRDPDRVVREPDGPLERSSEGPEG